MKTAAIIAILALLLPVNAGAQEWSKGSETTETLGQMLSATNTGIGKLGEIGEGLKDVASGQFVGARRARNALATSWNNSFEDWRRSSEGSKGSAGFKLVSKALWWNDFADGVVAPLVEGDGRGTVSGAVNIAINDTVVAAGTAAFAAAGAAIGSVIPTAGTAAGATIGATVGGAIGTVAGGFISSIAFDRFGKAFVAKGVEGVIASLLDVSPLQQAMNARDDYLRAQAAPELQQAWNSLDAVSQSFGSEGNVELIGPGTTPYVVMKKPETPTQVPPESAGEDVLAGATKFELTHVNQGFRAVVVCTASSGEVTCHGTGSFSASYTGGTVSTRSEYNGTGSMSGNVLNLQERSHILYAWSDSGCRASYEGNDATQHTLLPGGRMTYRSLGGSGKFLSFTGDCANLREIVGKTQTNKPSDEITGTWKVLQ
jgi:hypothetical protein